MLISAFDNILSLFGSNGCKRIIVKKLASNDNSKNQVYLGGHNAIGLLPSAQTILNKQTSQKSSAKKFIFQKILNFYWLNNNGPHRAEYAKLIYYPQYPETRFSGFLKGCRESGISELFDEKRKANFPRRILFLSSNAEGESFGYVLVATSKEEREIDKLISPMEGNETVLWEMLIGIPREDSRNKLLSVLKKIHSKGWIQSCKLSKNGEKRPYSAQNGGGYTLEAEFGIAPNSDINPDYAGWEIKQHSHNSKVVTLLTPEPDAGLYNEKGAEYFVKKYGYPDQAGRSNRINFGGVYKNNKDFNNNTNLKFGIVGFTNGEISSDGFMGLFNLKNEPVAKWSFGKLLEHWSKKHTRTVFVLSERKKCGETSYYRYLNEIKIGVGTNFFNFLKAVESGFIYLDPAIKLEIDKQGNTKIKARNQFRINIKNLRTLYDKFEEIII